MQRPRWKTVAMALIFLGFLYTVFHWKGRIAWLLIQNGIPQSLESKFVDILTMCDAKEGRAAAIYLSGRHDNDPSRDWVDYIGNMDGLAWAEGLSRLIQLEASGVVVLNERTLRLERFKFVDFHKLPSHDMHLCCNRAIEFHYGGSSARGFGESFVCSLTDELKWYSEFSEQLNLIAQSLLVNGTSELHVRFGMSICRALRARNELQEFCVDAIFKAAGHQFVSAGFSENMRKFAFDCNGE